MLNLHRLHRILGPDATPAYVKTAATQPEPDVPANGWADPIGKQYPCHTKAAAYASYVLASEAGADSYLMDEIRKLAAFWSVPAEDLSAADEKIAASKRIVVLDEMPDHSFALVQQYNGQKLRKFASVDAESTVDAALAFHESRHRYPLEWRKAAATRLLERAERYGANLPAYVEESLNKSAGFGYPSQESLDDLLIERVNLLGLREPDAQTKLSSAIDEVGSVPALRHDDEVIGGLLGAIDQFDRDLKLAQHYETGRVSLPEDCLVLTTTKLAKYAGCASRIVRLVNGVEIDIAALSTASLDAVDAKLAKMSSAKLAEVLPTLPKPEADLLCEVMPSEANLKTAAESPLDVPAEPKVEKTAAAPVEPASQVKVIRNSFERHILGD